jgi:hypothetical protein
MKIIKKIGIKTPTILPVRQKLILNTLYNSQHYKINCYKKLKKKLKNWNKKRQQ